MYIFTYFVAISAHAMMVILHLVLLLQNFCNEPKYHLIMLKSRLSHETIITEFFISCLLLMFLSRSKFNPAAFVACFRIRASIIYEFLVSYVFFLLYSAVPLHFKVVHIGKFVNPLSSWVPGWLICCMHQGLAILVLVGIVVYPAYVSKYQH